MRDLQVNIAQYLSLYYYYDSVKVAMHSISNSRG